MWGKSIDPVCKIEVGKKTPYAYKFNSRTYYFDFEACKQDFKEEPVKFIKNNLKINISKDLLNQEREF